MDDQTATLTMLSNAAFVMGSLVSMLPLAGVPLIGIGRRRSGSVRRPPVAVRPPFPYYPPKRLRRPPTKAGRGAVRVKKVRKPNARPYDNRY